MKSSKKLLIFGGTFDPIHKGHIKILQSAINKVDPNLTLIIPTKNPPLKDNLPEASIKDRLAMINLAIKKFHNVKVCDYEISNKDNGKSYTYLTVQYLKKKYPGYKLYFLLGADRINDFKKWKNWKFLKNNLTMVIAHRSGMKCAFPGAINLLISETDISSKELRTNPSSKYLDTNVLKYIANNGVYAYSQIKPLMSEYRFKHTLRVANTALDIACIKHKKLIEKAYAAAMYHDVAKEFNRDEILELVPKYSKKRFPNVHTLHGCASAEYIKKNFYVTDKDVLLAVYDHVIPPRNPSVLSKILYCADKLEPARTEKDIPNRKQLLDLAKTDLDKAFNHVLAYNKSRY